MPVLHFHPESDSYFWAATYKEYDGLVEDVSDIPEHVERARNMGVIPPEFETTMYLSDLIGDKFAVIEAAMKHPAMHPKRKPTMETALKAVVAQVELVAAEAFRQQIEPLIDEAYGMYTINNGEYADVEPMQRDDWESGLDDVIENVFEPYMDYLSQNWLGSVPMDAKLWEEDAVAKLAQSAGKEVFKQLAHNKSPAQTLSNAGIVQADVEPYFANNSTPQETKAMAENNAATVDELLVKVRQHVGSGADVLEVQEAFEWVIDDDDIMAESAAERIGLTMEDVEVFRMFALENGEDTVNMLIAKLDDVQEQKPAKASKAKAAAAATPPTPPAPKTAATPPAPSAPAGAEIDWPAVLTAVQNHSAVKDTELAAALGVSRQTYTNYAAGKSKFKPEAAQAETVRNRIVADLNGLYAAMCAIDGVAVEQTWE